MLCYIEKGVVFFFYLFFKVIFGFIIGVEIKYCEFYDVFCVVGMFFFFDDCELVFVLVWYVILFVL